MGTGEFLNPFEVLAPHILDRYNRAAGSDGTVQIVTENDFGYAATRGGEGDTLTWNFRAEMVRDICLFGNQSLPSGISGRASVGDRPATGRKSYSGTFLLARTSFPIGPDLLNICSTRSLFCRSTPACPYPWPHMTAVEAGNIIGGWYGIFHDDRYRRL